MKETAPSVVHEGGARVLDPGNVVHPVGLVVVLDEGGERQGVTWVRPHTPPGEHHTTNQLFHGRVTEVQNKLS